MQFVMLIWLRAKICHAWYTIRISAGAMLLHCIRTRLCRQIPDRLYHKKKVLRIYCNFSNTTFLCAAENPCNAEILRANTYEMKFAGISCMTKVGCVSCGSCNTMCHWNTFFLRYFPVFGQSQVPMPETKQGAQIDSVSAPKASCFL